MLIKQILKNRIILILLIFLPTSLFAQNEVWRYYEVKDTLIVEAEKVTQIPSFSTMVSKIPISLQNTPASVGVVLKPLFDSQNATILSHALENVSGVNIQSQFGVHDYFLIRGFNSVDNGMVLTDGTIETESTFYNLYNIERIEVLKGPGAFLYGGNPLSGAVNLWRKQPIFRNFLNATGSFGHFRTFRGTADLGIADINSGLAFRMNAFWHESDNFRDGKDSRQIAVNPAFTWRLNRNSDITINFEYAKNDYRPDSGLPLLFLSATEPATIPDIPRERSYQTPFDDSDQNIYRVRADFSSKLSESLTLRNKLYFADQDWKTTGTLLVGAFPAPPVGAIVVGRVVQRLQDRQKYLGNQFDLLFDLNTGAIRHQLVTGFEVTGYNDDFLLRFGQISPISLLDPFETTQQVHISTLPQSSQADARTLIIAPYLVDQVSLSEKLKVFLGGRYDVLDYDDDRRDIDVFNSIDFASQTERNYKKFSPMGGIVLAPSTSFSLYANAGKAFAPPSTLTRGTPEPEESVQIELGAKLRFNEGRINTSLALFNLEKGNIAIPDQTGVFRQIGDQRSRGVELEVVAQPLNNVFSSLSYAFTKAELTDFSEDADPTQGVFVIDRSGNTAPFAPKHIVNFWTTKSFRNGFGVGAGSRYVSSQFIDEDNAFEINGYLLFDAMIFYQRQGWQWSVNFKNITNRDYETRGFGNSSVIPANPFTMYSTVQITL